MKRARSYEKDLQQELQDPVQAAGYLEAAYADPDRGVFLLALKDVVEAHSGITRIARAAGLDRRHLYVMLSRGGNPEWFSINRLLDALGLQLSFEPKPHRAEKKAA